jgi:alkenylglycerophosphocholine/alkenylglycerophosphoethanolamine hydrolase
MVMLVGVAAVAGPDVSGARWLVVVAAVFGVLGDAALLGSGTKWFIRGLLAFAIGHSFYVAAALVVGVGANAWWGAAFVSLLFAWRFLPRVVPAARKSGGTAMMVAVLFYATIIAAMVITATGTGRWLAAGGAALFALSDWVLGQRQFVGAHTFHRLSVMVPYHVGQTMLIAGLLGVAV